MPFFAYILECADATLYAGSTTDLEKRLHAHNSLKSGAKYTRARRPVRLAYSEKLPTFEKMCAREAEFKRLTRKEKFALIGKAKKKIPAQNPHVLPEGCDFRRASAKKSAV